MTPSSEVPPLLLETLERAWLEEMIAGFTPAESKAVGLALTDTEAGTVVSLRVFPDVPLFNRTLNLGMYRPVTDAALDELLTVARDLSMVRLMAGLIPGAQPDDLRDRLLQRGAQTTRATVQLTRAPEVQHVQRADLHVRVMDAGDQEAFIDIMVRGMGMPLELSGFPRSLFRRSGWTHYLAWIGGTAVACASLHVDGEAAWFGSAATLPEHRGLGAQTALIARRLNDAARAGVWICSMQVDEDLPDRPNPSERNMRRAGFQTAYRREHLLVPTGMAE